MKSREAFVVEDSTVLSAVMEKINRNSRGICFVEKRGKLVGSVSDGDIRRFLLQQLDLNIPIKEVMNRDVVSLPANSSSVLIRTSLTEKVKIIPLLNEAGQIVDFADYYSNHVIPILQPLFDGNELKYVTDCVRTSWVSSQGKYVQKFEDAFEEIHQGMKAVSVANGTVALHLALNTLGIGPGDEVIVPNLTFAATVNAVIHAGATPVLCDVCADTFCIDLDLVPSLITPSTKAIIPVHLYGQPCDMDRLEELSKVYNLLVIEDCAESLGSRWKGKRVGMFGDASTFSFFGNKTISTGEGGMILFKRKIYQEKAKVLRDHGMNKERKYWHDSVGFNYRMTNMQAALGVAQMERFYEIVSRKIALCDEYNKNLAGTPGIALLPHKSDTSLNSYWLYTILLDKSINKDLLIDNMRDLGIETRPIFFPLHEMKPYSQFRTTEKLDNSVDISLCGISLPSSIGLTQGEISFICTSLINLLENQIKD